MNAGANNNVIRQPNKDLNLIQREADCSRSSRITARDVSGGNIFRYSKWHRLNQEVGKTTKKNKLDKNPCFCYFDASRRLTTARPLGARIENKQYICGKRNSRNFMRM